MKEETRRFLDILKNKEATAADAVNGSGLIGCIETEDVVPLLHAASVLKDMDERYIDEIAKALS